MRGVQVLEVTSLWGDTTLDVKHLLVPKSGVVFDTDLFGDGEAPLVVATRGVLEIAPPPHTEVVVDGHAGIARSPYREPHVRAFELTPGHHVEIAVGSVAIALRLVTSEPASFASRLPSVRALCALGLTATVHAGVGGAAWFCSPVLFEDDDDVVLGDQIFRLQMLQHSDDRALDPARPLLDGDEMPESLRPRASIPSDAWFVDTPRAYCGAPRYEQFSFTSPSWWCLRSDRADGFESCTAIRFGQPKRVDATASFGATPHAPASKLGPGGLIDALEANEPCAIHACYARASAGKSTRMTGEIRVRISIDDEGFVQNATDAGGDFPAGEVRACVIDVVRALPFATNSRHVDAIVPVYFTQTP